MAYKESVLSSVVRTGGEGQAVSVEQVKNYLRVDYDVDDTIIQFLIKGAQSEFENYTRRTLFESNIVAYFSSFGDTIRLPYAPVIEVNDVRVQFEGGEPFQVEYEVLYEKDVSIRLNHTYGKGYSLIVDYKAGMYEEGETVHHKIVLGLLKWIATNYEDRQDTADFVVHEVPNGSKAMWNEFRVLRI